MRDSLKISVAQFEPKDGEKYVNLKAMEDLTRMASQEGAEVVSFHELCTTGYTFLKNLDKGELEFLAEEIPEGESVARIIELARQYEIVVMAGVLEKENGRFYNTYVVADGKGLIAR